MSRIARCDGITISKGGGAAVSTIEEVEHVPLQWRPGGATRFRTISAVWDALAGETAWDAVLRWPPDLFAFTDALLDRSDAYRFVVSPPPGASWPPGRIPGWSDAVRDAARSWVEALSGDAELPPLLVGEWGMLTAGKDVTLSDLREGRPWDVCEAILTLHALADEACAGAGVATEADAGVGCEFRGRAREWLAEAGSLSRLPADGVRILPKTRVASGGISLRSLTRYVCAQGPGVEAVWRKAPARRRATSLAGQFANILLVPWPTVVHASDFHRVGGPLENMDPGAFGFFEFAPREPLDLGLLDGILSATREEVDSVDVVVLPEGAIDASDLPALEALLHTHHVSILVAGVRASAPPGEAFGENFVHLAIWVAGHWWHYRQDKHHRWCLEQSQIHQYHLGAALHPRLRWWEAVNVPARTVHLIEVGAGVVVAPLVCEDLARLDAVSELLRSMGPTLIVTVLLDGPQVASRWTARYASVLADDPGSAVLTLSSAGMVARSRPPGATVKPVIALWKDPIRGLFEISLDQGADAVMVTAYVDRTTNWTADGRCHRSSTSDILLAAIHQVSARRSTSHYDAESAPCLDCDPNSPGFDVKDLTKLTGWMEALAEAAAATPPCVREVLAVAQAHDWRRRWAFPPPTPAFDETLAVIARALEGAGTIVTPDDLLTCATSLLQYPDRTARIAARLLVAAVESRHERDEHFASRSY